MCVQEGGGQGSTHPSLWDPSAGPALACSALHLRLWALDLRAGQDERGEMRESGGCEGGSRLGRVSAVADP